MRAPIRRNQCGRARDVCAGVALPLLLLITFSTHASAEDRHAVEPPVHQWTVLQAHRKLVADGGAAMEFPVRFTPLDAGARQAVLTIASNDSNEASFHFTIARTGGMRR